jgi:hypothetical protein
MNQGQSSPIKLDQGEKNFLRRGFSAQALRHCASITFPSASTPGSFTRSPNSVRLAHFASSLSRHHRWVVFRFPCFRRWRGDLRDGLVPRSGVSAWATCCEAGCLATFCQASAKPFARGSRWIVSASWGDVTNGPPSRGAMPVKATLGISLSLPARGNSFRKG